MEPLQPEQSYIFVLNAESWSSQVKAKMKARFSTVRTVVITTVGGNESGYWPPRNIWKVFPRGFLNLFSKVPQIYYACLLLQNNAGWWNTVFQIHWSGFAFPIAFEILFFSLCKQVQDIITHFYLHNSISQLSLFLFEILHLEQLISHFPLQKLNAWQNAIPLRAAPCRDTTSEHFTVTKMTMVGAPTAALTSSHSSVRNTSDLSETNRAHLLDGFQ